MTGRKNLKNKAFKRKLTKRNNVTVRIEKEIILDPKFSQFQDSSTLKLNWFPLSWPNVPYFHKKKSSYTLCIAYYGFLSTVDDARPLKDAITFLRSYRRRSREHSSTHRRPPSPSSTRDTCLITLTKVYSTGCAKITLPISTSGKSTEGMGAKKSVGGELDKSERARAEKWHSGVGSVYCVLHRSREFAVFVRRVVFFPKINRAWFNQLPDVYGETQWAAWNTGQVFPGLWKYRVSRSPRVRHLPRFLFQFRRKRILPPFLGHCKRRTDTFFYYRSTR